MHVFPPKSTLPGTYALSGKYHSQSLDLSDTLRPLALLDSEELEDQRRIVLSRDTSIVLELNFTPSPGHPLAFDALEIPRTCSVNHVIDRNNLHLLSLQVLLVDALTSIWERIDGWRKEKDNERGVSPSLVDFRAEQNIIHLYNGKAVVRFTLPCCFLDSMHRTGLYR